MSRLVAFICVLVLAGLGGAAQHEARGQAGGAKKLALVIGIGKYENFGPERELKRARADAVAIAATLTKLGYDVTVPSTGPNRGELNDVIDAFTNKVSAGDTVVVYFSGHGMQFEGLDYLLPRDIKKFGTSELSRAKADAKPLHDLIGDIAKRRPRVTITIIDACRNNPFAVDGKSGAETGGLAVIKPADGNIVLYAASSNETALEQLPGIDGRASTDTDAHSLFTRKLLPLMERPGLAIHDLARQLREDVRVAALAVNHLQRPTSSGEIDGAFCFAGGDCREGAGLLGATGKPKSSIEEGRRQVKLNNFSNAKEHFAPLAAEGKIDAIRELYFLAVESKDMGAALDWLQAAANLDDPSALAALSWYASKKDSAGDLPKSWKERLSDEEAKRMATKSYQKGEPEAALILQDFIGNSDEAISLKFAPEFQQQVDREFPPALAMMANILFARLPDAADLKPAHKPDLERAARLFERAALKGNEYSIKMLVVDTSFKASLEALKIKQLSSVTVQLLLSMFAESRPLIEKHPWGKLVGEFSPISLSKSERGDLVENFIELVINRAVTPNEINNTLSLTDDLITLRSEMARRSRSVSKEKLRKAQNLKVSLLQKLNRNEDAVKLLSEVADSKALLDMLEIARQTNWTPAIWSMVVSGFNSECAEMSFGDSINTMEDCEKFAHKIILENKSDLYLSIHNFTRNWLKSDSGVDLETGRAFFLLATLTQSEPSFLQAGESVKQHLTKAARLGAQDAASLLRSRGLPVPDVEPKLRSKQKRILKKKQWISSTTSDVGTVTSCKTSSDGTIYTRSIKRVSPKLIVLVNISESKVGQVLIDTGVRESLKIESIRVFIDHDEYPGQLQASNTRINLPGDQSLLIAQLGKGVMLRVEYKVGTKSVIDAYSLEGFTETYKSLIAACPGMISALDQQSELPRKSAKKR